MDNNSIKIKNDCVAKILVIGDSKVGKSCIITRFTENFFTLNTTTTVGIDYKTKKIKLDEVEIKLQIWDTAGQERFRSITQNFYKNANGIMVVFDLTDLQTFLNVHNWLKQIKTHVGDNVCRLLVGNKSDLTDSRAVTKEQINQLATEINCEYFEVSAKTGENITDAFYQISKDVKDVFFPNAKPKERMTLSIRPGNQNDNDVSGPKCCK